MILGFGRSVCFSVVFFVGVVISSRRLFRRDLLLGRTIGGIGWPCCRVIVYLSSRSLPVRVPLISIGTTRYRTIDMRLRRSGSRPFSVCRRLRTIHSGFRSSVALLCDLCTCIKDGAGCVYMQCGCRCVYMHRGIGHRADMAQRLARRSAINLQGLETPTGHCPSSVFLSRDGCQCGMAVIASMETMVVWVACGLSLIAFCLFRRASTRSVARTRGTAKEVFLAVCAGSVTLRILSRFRTTDVCSFFSFFCFQWLIYPGSVFCAAYVHTSAHTLFFRFFAVGFYGISVVCSDRLGGVLCLRN